MIQDVPLAPYEQEMMANVEKFGCAVLHVSDNPTPDRNFSYSVGFPTSVSQPEVLVFGLAKDLMLSMVNEVFRQCKEDGLVLSDGQKIGNLIEGFDCVLREITHQPALEMYFGSAMRFHLRRGSEPMVNAFQIVWPDPKSKKLPWEDGCAPNVIQWQEALYSESGKA